MKYITLFLLALLLSASVLQSQTYERYKILLDTTLESKALGFEKNIKVTVPFTWQENLGSEFPLIVVFDSQNQRSHGYILNTIDYLSSTEQMPLAVVISVESTQEHRLSETLHSISGERGMLEKNEMFLFEELIPLAEEKWKASKYRIFVGHSRYGYFTTSLFHNRIDELNAVIALSPFYTQTNVNLVDSLAQLENLDLSTKKYYRYGVEGAYLEHYNAIDSLLSDFDNPMIDADGRFFLEADHNAVPGLTIAPALYDIFEYWAEGQAIYFSNENKDVGQLKIQSANIRQHYGSDFSFGLGVLNGKGWYFYNEGEFDLAIAAWRELLRAYPSFSEGYLYIFYAEQEMERDTQKTISDLKASLKVSKFYSEAEKQEILAEVEKPKE
ncbi:alpha/beta hydrolase-fold protein [Halocola ammonii]